MPRILIQCDNEMHRLLREGGLELFARVVANRQIDAALTAQGRLDAACRRLREEGVPALVEEFYTMSLTAYEDLFGGQLPDDLHEPFEAAYRQALTERFTALAAREQRSHN